MSEPGAIKRCSACGFPNYGKLLRWNSNGTVTSKIAKGLRAIIIHADLMGGLFSSIERKIGLPIDKIITNAQANTVRAMFDAIIDRVYLAQYTIKLDPSKRSAIRIFNRVSLLSGMSLSETVEYVPGEYGLFRITNPYHPELMAANIVGAFDSLERRPHSFSLELDTSESYLVRVEPVEEKAEIAGRLEAVISPVASGNLQHFLCHRCGVPVMLGENLKYHESEGIIMNMGSGARVILSPAYMVNSVFRELEREMGEEIQLLIIDSQREWTISRIRDTVFASMEKTLTKLEFETVFREHLTSLAIYGQGNAVRFEVDNHTVTVVIENPFDIFVLAGNLQGLYEALGGQESRITWQIEKEGVVSYKISPRY